MKVLKTVDESKVYCDECRFLEERPTLAETSFGSGEYAQTGTRFYCSKYGKWYTINSTIEEIGFCWCLGGEKKDEGDLPAYKILHYKGKEYRIKRITTVFIDVPSCEADFLYKGKWREVKNTQILIDLRKVFEDL
jgi:hypothetical protein